jgi:peroxiredoxin
LRSFQQRLGDFTARGVKVVAISVDPVEINQRHAQRMGYTFPLLSDADAATIRRYDLLHPHAGPKQEDISRPAEFYVDGNGIVRWVNLTQNIAVRARPEQALSAIDSARGASSQP